MVWIPKCCDTQTDEINKAMRSTVKLYYKALKTTNSSGTQKNTYNPSLVITKRCHVRDRSQIAQDTAINSGKTNPENSKEFIFKYFDVTNYEFNELEWSGSRFQVLNTGKNHTFVDSKRRRYNSTDQQPFIVILAGLTKL